VKLWTRPFYQLLPLKMTSLADELDLDPAFDANFGNMGEGAPLTLGDEEEIGYECIDEVNTRRGGRSRRGKSGRGRGRAHASDEDEAEDREHLVLGGANEGFSLADELGGGGGGPTQGIETSLADEFEGDGGEYVVDDNFLKKEQRNDETKARKDQEHYLVSSEILNDSLRMTEDFLAKLKKTSAASHASMSTSLSSSSILVSGAGSDDTSKLEGGAGKVLRQLQDYSRAREDQIRELQDCDRLLRRAFEEGGDWINALADVDDFESEDGKSTTEASYDLACI
jgi:hypothetical protein